MRSGWNSACGNGPTNIAVIIDLSRDVLNTFDSTLSPAGSPSRSQDVPQSCPHDAGLLSAKPSNAKSSMFVTSPA